MATFTDWMRLGEARMTSLATLALGVGMALLAPESADAAHPAAGERSVSGVRITLGEEGRRWTLVPTLLDGKVESFLALREDMAYGENLTAVWYRKVAAADGTESWETKAFEDQDQSKAIRAVKLALALGDSTDESWPVAVAAVAAAEPEPMVKGVLESDALAPLVADLEDPQPIVEMLEDAGLKAAWIGPLEGGQLATAEPGVVACPQHVVLAALASGVEASSVAGADLEAVAFAKLQAGCLGICLPWTWTSAGPTPWSPWVCLGWQVTQGPQYTHCGITCHYERMVVRSRTRVRTQRRLDCTRVSWTQTQTQDGSQTGRCTDDLADEGCDSQPPCPPAPCNPATTSCEPTTGVSSSGWWP